MDIRYNGNFIPDTAPTGGPPFTSLDIHDGTGITWTFTRVSGRVVAIPNVTGGGGGGVSSVSSTNTAISVATPTTTPALTLGTLDVIAADGPPAANWSNNSKKITSLANGTVSTDAAAFGQIPTSLPPNGSASGDLTGTYPGPTLAAFGGGAAGPTGDATHVPVVTVDAKGRVSALTSTLITGTTPGGSAGGDLTGTYPNPTLAAFGGGAAGPIGDSGHVPVVTVDAKGRVSALTSAAITITQDQYPYIYITAADEVIPANAQVIYEDYLELSASFAYELSAGAMLVVGDYATPLPLADITTNLYVATNNVFVDADRIAVIDDVYEIMPPAMVELNGGEGLQPDYGGVLSLVGSQSTLPGVITGADNSGGFMEIKVTA